MVDGRKCCGWLVSRTKDLALYDPFASIKDDSFFLQESPLFGNQRTGGAPGEAMKRSVGGNDTMAGDLRREGVYAERSADGLRRFASDFPCDPPIGCNLSMRNA